MPKSLAAALWFHNDCSKASSIISRSVFAEFVPVLAGVVFSAFPTESAGT